MAQAERSVSYRALLEVPGFVRLAGATLLVRTASSMWQLALVLFILSRYGSPTLAGISVFLSSAPGILVSPIAGALLDRYGRARLMVADYLVSALALTTIVLLTAVDAPLPVVLLPVIVSSLTNPLGTAGSRSLFPLMVPARLWDRANAVDSIAYMTTTVIGAPLAGAIVAFTSAQFAIAATAAVYVAGAVTLAGVSDVARLGPPSGRLLAEARDGLTYVLRNITLRGLAVGMSIQAMGHGILLVALPVLVLDRGYGGPSVVGALWAVMGIVGIAAGLVAGRLGSAGRERPMLVGAILFNGIGFVALANAGSFASVAAAVVIIGAGSAVADVAMFSLRQRATDVAWFGRAFAVSMHLNYSGVPVGSALSGPLLAVSIPFAFGGAALLAALSAGITWLMVPSSRGD